MSTNSKNEKKKDKNCQVVIVNGFACLLSKVYSQVSDSQEGDSHMIELLRNFQTMNITLKYFIQSNYDKITQPYIISYMAVTALASLAGTIVTFLETSSLRETRNFFIINLAIADLLVNGIVMPYSIF
uniref:G-protein coupled receptors family 1 profile domain-containing protein n=1 Tax=Romanomermis culicivorax TaxID=13658 RepID=A0A915IRQ6_ROMCU